MDFLRTTLERFPRLPASVLHEMVVRRGYTGGQDYFRHRLYEADAAGQVRFCAANAATR